jgi:F420-non-reducing hydrogenase small subunit
LCPKAELTCRGCYGSAGLATDQGTAMLSAIGSVMDAVTEERANELVGQIADPTGTFYRFSLASSTLKAHR